MTNSTKNGLRQKCHAFPHIRVDPLSHISGGTPEILVIYRNSVFQPLTFYQSLYIYTKPPPPLQPQVPGHQYLTVQNNTPYGTQHTTLQQPTLAYAVSIHHISPLHTPHSSPRLYVPY
jgi:hypothetical protein